MEQFPLNPTQFRRIATRNLLLPLALAALLSGLFIFLIFQLVSANKLLNQADQAIGKGHEVLQLMVDAETGMRGYILTKEEDFLTPYENSKRNFLPSLTDLKAKVIANDAQLERLERVERLYARWIVYSREVFAADANFGSIRSKVLSEEGKDLIDKIRDSLRDFIRQEETLRDERNQKSHNSVRVSLLIIVIASAVVGIFLAIHSRRQFGHISSIYGRALDRSNEQKNILEHQNWLRAAQGEISAQLQGDLKLESVSQKALDFICTYLDAKVGVLYSVSTENDLTLSATYATPPEHSLDKLKAKDGLIGRVLTEGRALTLDPAPPGYLKISSTLGNADSQAIAIAPLTADGKVKGIIEAGFTRSLKKQEQELLEFIGENVGLAITSAQYRERLQELLEESQSQAEELQAQQEELRVNNEELEEQSSALKESQARLESQQAELEQTNQQLNQQANALEQKNDELNEARKELEDHARDLQRASEYKSQFLANMSHELRTPLNSTLILAQLLMDNKNGHLTHEEVEYARTILASSNDLLALINDILDLSKVEAGKIELQPETISLPALITSIERTFSPIAQNKGIALNLKSEADLPEFFTTDKLRLEQILRNLLSNAIKFTTSGSVELALEKRSEKKIAFMVKDTGIGIPEDKQKLIFEAFKQADGTTNRHFGGTGLGLTISQDLAKLLAGRIEVQSEPGKGSTFTLELGPLEQGPQETTHTSPLLGQIKSSQEARQKILNAHQPIHPAAVPDDRVDLDQKKKLLLVVEDDEAFAKVIRDLSHQSEFQCLIALTAEEAIALAQEYLPHAIILDLVLPDHHGLFVLDRLKENPATRHIPVHIISSTDQSQTALEMGAIGHLVKPATKESVIDVIHKLEEKFTQNIRKVLIVEDNSIQRESMKKLIQDNNVEVITATTGAQAIDQLSQTSFDCLILDLSLPDMSGFEVLERMGSARSLSHPPVIVYTGRDLNRHEEQQLQRYSQSIILKGAKSHERLISEVSLFLHQVESEMPPERQRALRELRDRERDLEDKLILLVDDDVRNIFALKNALEARGARTEIARNGREAVAKVKENDQIELVLMDIMMPEMNGFEAMREIRRDSKFKNLPIIAVTAKAMPDDQEKCIEAGANDYLAKPIDLPKLLSLIRVWLRPNRKRENWC